VTHTPAQDSSLINRLRSQLSGPSQEFLTRGIKADFRDEANYASVLNSRQQLDVLENVLNEIKPANQAKESSETVVAAVGPTRKESIGGVINPAEQVASIQYVEEEKSPEISPEVEKYLNEVRQDRDKAPKEIVIADVDQDLPSQDKYVSEPVIVLPITPGIEKKGKHKSPKFSIRWLVEWSQKIIKMFAGKVVYRQVES
jgi:hypothetical protein